MHDLFGLTLRPAVSCSAPASRPLASSANGWMQKSSADRIQLPIVLDFQSDNGRERIGRWYNEQPVTQFWKLELRKETGGHFKHEFIVVRLGSLFSKGSLCRFDRRAQENMRGHALKDEGTTSEDTAHVITPADVQAKAELDKSEVVLTVIPYVEQDLEHILTVCCAIQYHPHAKSYSLLRYNCYFFCWTLVTTTGRRASNWKELLNPNLWAIITDALLLKFRFRHMYHGPKSILPPDEGCIYESMERKLKDYSFVMTPDALDKTLLETQLYLVLRNAISLALKEGGQIGEELLATHAAKRNSDSRARSIPRPIDSKEGSQNKISFLGQPLAPSNIIHIPWLSSIGKKRTLCKAQKISAELYDKLMSCSEDTIRGSFKGHNYTTYQYFTTSRVVYDEQYYGRPEPLQIDITKRMTNHFEQVERYGFGNAKDLIDQAEKTMTEIWGSVVDMMKDESQLSFL